MSTLKELMGDLTRGDGRKFLRSRWETSGAFHRDIWFEPIFKDENGVWCGLFDLGVNATFCDAEDDDWQEWTPAQQIKKVKLYRPIFGKNDFYNLGEWRSKKEVCPAFDGNKFANKHLAGRQEMEIEVMEIEVTE